MNNLKEFNSAKPKSKSGLIILLVIIIISLIGGIFFLHFNYEQKIVEVEKISTEKANLTIEYQSLLDNYQNLETSNDTLSVQLSTEKEKITVLMKKLKSTKAQNKAEIEKYKKELKTLRNIMKGFIHQIDSLNTLNIQLTEENQQIKKQIYTAKKENKKLTEKYKDAESKVALASTIKAIDLNLESYNHKGKTTARAKKVKRFGIIFKLDENLVAPKGIKQIYIRVTDPEEHVLIENEEMTFLFDNEEIVYSALREIEYDGNTTPATVYFENNREKRLPSGIYKVDIFCDGKMIGSTTKKLK